MVETGGRRSPAKADRTAAARGGSRSSARHAARSSRLSACAVPVLSTTTTAFSPTASDKPPRASAWRNS